MESETSRRPLNEDGEQVAGYRSLKFSGKVQAEDRNLGTIRTDRIIH